MDKWNGKNVLWTLVYLALYLIGTAVTCFMTLIWRRFHIYRNFFKCLKCDNKTAYP